MKTKIEKHGITTLDELKKYFVFGENCRICIPYVELILKTGKTEFEVINFDYNDL